MINLVRDDIKKIATDETVFLRGVRYYKNQTVSNVRRTKSGGQFHATVKGSNDYNVSVDISEKGISDHHCNCAGHAKYPGACKHVVALLLFLSDYLNRQNDKRPESSEDMAAYKIVQYFEKQDYPITYGDFYEIGVSIRIPALLREEDSKVYVSLRAGANRMYKIQNIRKFLFEYQHKETIVLGKEFKFIHGESTFTRESQNILDYFLDIYEVHEALSSTAASSLFQKNYVVITKNMLIKLLHILKDMSFSLELYGQEYDPVSYRKENPSICLGVDMTDDIITIEDKQSQNTFPLTDKGQLMLVGNVIYEPDRQFIKNYVPFYSFFGKQNKPLVFKGETKDQFLQVVLPKIYDTMELDITEQLKDKFIVSELKPVIYLDKHKQNVRATVKFQYGDYTINPLDYVAKDGIIIVRQPQKEKEILYALEDMHFVPSRNYYALRDEKYIFYFLTEGVGKLQELCELYYSDDFRNLTMKSPGQLSTKLRVDNELNMLEVELNYEDIPKEELRELFHSIQLKKKYHRLKNGNFIPLTTEEFDEVSNLLEHLKVEEDNIKEDSILLPKHTALYINNVLEENKYIKVKKEDDFQNLIDGILSPAQTNYEIPNEITVELRPYQVTGFKWLKTLSANGLGGVLADDMGLGKTLQTIVYISSTIKEANKSGDNKVLHLIICPTSLVYNWQDEFANFAPDVRTCVVSGAPEIRKEIIEAHDDVDVIITSYPLIRRDIEHYQKLPIHTMFIDEAQFIKNANSISAKAVKMVESKHRFALTGTPIENSLSELWSIFDFVMPYYLYSHNQFVERYEKPIVRDQNRKALEDLTKHISPFILRRMKSDVLEELPEKIESKYTTDMTEEQKKVYLSYMESIRSELSMDLSKGAAEHNRIKILAALTRLRQICCHPATFVDNFDGGSGKLDLLMDILPDIILNGHRILIFSQFTSMLQIIATELRKQDVEYYYLEGSTPVEERARYVKEFNEGQRKVFLISLKAGGTGLNLTGADTVIHYDPWWNPAVEEQATDRVYRIGQKNSVHVIKLLTKGTIEEKIYKLQQKKKALSEAVIQSKEVFINKLTREEIEDLFQM